MEAIRPEARERFIEAMSSHTEAMTQQAEDRSRNYLPMRSIQSYLEVRRHTMGAKPAFTFLAFDFDIPWHILDGPIIRDLETWATDLLILSNVGYPLIVSATVHLTSLLAQDLYSYPKEHADGDDGHNIVAIAMHELNVGLDGAIKWASDYQADLVKKFVSSIERLPSFGIDIDRQLEEYVRGIGSFVMGHDAWCFESERYFGKNGKSVQKHRRVTLLSPRRGRHGGN